MGQQASSFVRLSTLPSPVPNYLNVDQYSDWLNTGLVCSALETSTLPTRLTRSTGRHASLSLLEDILNTNGNQNIFELQLSLNDEADDHVQNGGTNGTAVLGVGGRSTNAQQAEDEPAPEARAFDINFTSSHTQSEKSSGHTFGQVESRRSDTITASAGSLSPEERMRRRYNEETVVEL